MHLLATFWCLQMKILHDLLHVAIRMPTLESDPFPCMISNQIHAESIAQQIGIIDYSDPSNLPFCFLKEVSIEIAPILSLIFQGALPEIFGFPVLKG